MLRKLFILKIFFLIFVLFSNTNVTAQNNGFENMRKRMVRNQIVARGIKTPKVIKAINEVPRHLFVPTEYKLMAYEDRPLPIGEGQTISQPYIVALMTDALKLDENTKVLEIGTGSGYQAAILAEICKDVYSIEIIESLGLKAKQVLNTLNYSNIHTKIGDGYKGWIEFAPYDAIIVTCAPTNIPKELKKQLTEGGKMIIPVGGSIAQELILLKKKNGKLIREVVAPVRFVPMLKNSGKRY
ncbi:MAG: protein-L-isoaspartate(D-aspartate) O-methyltransferase [Bacteroidota bacterium]|nr:protein-L-isoaspartate(D-aspartate) O-methyltransferase [Bacteroidota bacterium]